MSLSIAASSFFYPTLRGAKAFAVLRQEISIPKAWDQFDEMQWVQTRTLHTSHFTKIFY